MAAIVRLMKGSGFQFCESEMVKEEIYEGLRGVRSCYAYPSSVYVAKASWGVRGVY